MKSHVEVSSSRRKCRKAHFTAPSHIRYRLMSTHLSKELRAKHSIRALPIRKDDEVVIVRGKMKLLVNDQSGSYKGNKGKVTQVYRRRWSVQVEKISKPKQNGAPYNIPLDPSQLVLTKLKLDRDRTALIKRKAATDNDKKKKIQSKLD